MSKREVISLKEYIDLRFADLDRLQDKYERETLERHRNEFVTIREHERELKTLQKLVYQGLGIAIMIALLLPIIVKIFIK